MHIGVDATCWLLPRGFGRHTRCLLTALRQIDAANRYTLFTDAPAAVESLEAVAPVQLVRTSTATVDAAALHGRRTTRDLIAMSRALASPSIDILFFPTVYSYVPVFSRARQLVMFHDATAERHPALTLDGWRARWFWRAKVALARRRADAIATVSEYSRRTLSAAWGPGTRPMHVIGEAGDPAFRRLADPQPTPALSRLGLDGPSRSIVYVGGFSPHKNLPLLIDVFARLKADAALADVKLVLVGDYSHESFYSIYRDVRGLVETLGLASSVVFTGFLVDEDLVVLLNRATVLALPSMMEGFGLPAIEAAACGCPVVATMESPLPELLGPGGLYVDPRQPAQLEAALREVLTSPQRQAAMQRAGIEAAGRLTWAAAASDLLRLLQQLAA